MYILTDEEFDLLRLTVSAARTPNGPKAMETVLDIVRRHEAADIDATAALLSDKVDRLVGAVTKALEDGKINLRDTGEAIDIYKVVADVADDWPEIQEEIDNLNELEMQLLGIELIKAIKKHIKRK